MDNTLSRFYKVSELFRDDTRLISVALKEHTTTKETKCAIYKDLLNCKYSKWIDRIEGISHLICDEWIEYRLFMIDNGHDTTFLRGDMKAIETMCYDKED